MRSRDTDRIHCYEMTRAIEREGSSKEIIWLQPKAALE